MNYESSVKSFRAQFAMFDREFTPALALKKKQDMRRLIYSGSDADRKAAFQTVWEEDQRQQCIN